MQGFTSIGRFHLLWTAARPAGVSWYRQDRSRHSLIGGVAVSGGFNSAIGPLDWQASTVHTLRVTLKGPLGACCNSVNCRVKAHSAHRYGPKMRNCALWRPDFCHFEGFRLPIRWISRAIGLLQQAPRAIPNGDAFPKRSVARPDERPAGRS